MNEDALLEALKVDLGITTSAYDSRLAQYLSIALSEITQEGITLDVSEFSDCNLIIMYAAWMWRKRTGDNQTLSGQHDISGMPRMLRWMLNNRLFSEKINEE